MADTVIQVDPFNPQSVALANRELQRQLTQFNERVQAFLEELALTGSQEAQMRYGSGAVSVTVLPIENGYAISADGREVVFLEFGAGAATNSGNMLAETMPFDVARGSFSDANQGEYQRTGYRHWHYHGVLYTEVMPRNAMEGAYNEMMNQWRDIAERVFA